ncbi:hypothetical protein GCM10023144_45510 [Pigmentiphaga soli]|uniref:Lipoprotein n=1 Tax=Pigmentiphaga soli TaxID=1007095 RepID=A0ABP8HR79_9BURK
MPRRFACLSAVLCACVLLEGCPSGGRDAPAAPDTPALYDAELLYADYRENPGAADRRYAGRVFTVTGRMQRVVPAAGGAVEMDLKAADPAAPVRAQLAPMQACAAGTPCAAADAVAPLMRGAKVYLRCTGGGPGARVPTLLDCVLADPPARKAG